MNIAIKNDAIEWPPNTHVESMILSMGMVSSKNNLQEIKWFEKSMYFTSLINPASNAETIVNTMMMAIVIAIGPMEFSTKAENIKAMDATVPILSMPKP